MLLLALLLAQDPNPLAEAAAKTAEKLSRYAFSTEFEVQGFGGAPGGPPSIRGTFTRDDGLHLKVGDFIEVAKKGMKIAYASRDKGWTAVEEKTSEESEKSRRDWRLRMIRNLKAPHEELKGIETKFKQVKKTESQETVEAQPCDVYAGELTPEGTKELMSSRGMFGRMDNLRVKGSGKVWVNPQQFIVRFQTEIETTGKFRDTDFTVTFTRTIKLAKLDEAASEIPEEAKKLLSD